MSFPEPLHKTPHSLKFRQRFTVALKETGNIAKRPSDKGNCCLILSLRDCCVIGMASCCRSCWFPVILHLAVPSFFFFLFYHIELIYAYQRNLVILLLSGALSAKSWLNAVQFAAMHCCLCLHGFRLDICSASPQICEVWIHMQIFQRGATVWCWFLQGKFMNCFSQRQASRLLKCYISCIIGCWRKQCTPRKLAGNHISS